MKTNKTQKILFLCYANDIATEKRVLAHEANMIQAALQRGGARRFELVTRLAGQLDELVRVLCEVEPTVLHISGHGQPAGTSLAARSGSSLHSPGPQAWFTQPAEYSQLCAGPASFVADAGSECALDQALQSVKLVFLDACYSQMHADALLPHVDCVVGTSAALADTEAARKFTSGLYSALEAQESVAAAYQRAFDIVNQKNEGGKEPPELKVRDGVDADRLILTASGAAPKKSKVDALLDALTEQATSEDLQPVAYFVGECVARRQSSTLARFHGRAQQLRRRAKPTSWHRGFAEALAAYLEGYFAEVEPAAQREKLAREVAENALWREILYALRETRGLNQGDIGRQIAASTPGVASSKASISNALDDLRIRELVEYVPGKPDRREKIHSLTLRGRELLEEPVISAARTQTESGDTGAGSTAADSILATEDNAQTRSVGDSEMDPERSQPSTTQRLPSEPPAAEG